MRQFRLSKVVRSIKLPTKLEQDSPPRRVTKTWRSNIERKSRRLRKTSMCPHQKHESLRMRVAMAIISPSCRALILGRIASQVKEFLVPTVNRWPRNRNRVKKCSALALCQTRTIENANQVSSKPSIDQEIMRVHNTWKLNGHPNQRTLHETRREGKVLEIAWIEE